MSATDLASTSMPRPADEEDRLAALHRYKLLDTPSSDDFTFLTELAAKVCDVPYSYISLVDRDRVWVKSYTGVKADAFARDNCYCSLAILSDDATYIPDLGADPRTASRPMHVGEQQLRMYSSVPLKSSDGYPLGTLCVFDTKPHVLSVEQRHMLGRLARQVMALIELRANEQALQESMLELTKLATTDALTGLHNRRSLLERLALEASRTKRYRTRMSAVMIDLDFFKRVNDRFGHGAGDIVLANVGALIRQSVRGSDIAGRYGGEEFCVVLPETGLAGACKFAETLRIKLASLTHGGAGVGALTASLGVAVIDHTSGDAASLIKQADEALYRAKHAGRNRVEC